MLPPTPTWVWSKAGMNTERAPNKSELETSRHAAMRGFKYVGDGWYEAQKCFVLTVGEDAFNLYFYDSDPRETFKKLWEMENK